MDTRTKGKNTARCGWTFAHPAGCCCAETTKTQTRHALGPRTTYPVGETWTAAERAEAERAVREKAAIRKAEGRTA